MRLDQVIENALANASGEDVFVYRLEGVKLDVEIGIHDRRSADELCLRDDGNLGRGGKPFAFVYRLGESDARCQECVRRKVVHWLDAAVESRRCADTFLLILTERTAVWPVFGVSVNIKERQTPPLSARRWLMRCGVFGAHCHDNKRIGKTLEVVRVLGTVDNRRAGSRSDVLHINTCPSSVWIPT